MNGVGPILSSIAAPPDPKKSPAAVGKQFEAMFASMLIKQMRQTLESDSMFPGDTSDVRGGLFDHFMGEHMAKSGQLGIGKIIQKQLEKRSPRT